MTPKIRWESLDLANIPSQSGIYGFKQGNRWLYIGKSINLSHRLNKHHVPLQIAVDLPRTKFYYHLTDSHHQQERQQIEKLRPEWNGRTAWRGGFPCCDLPYQSKVTPEERRKALSVIGF